MDKITIKLIKYFISIIALIIAICFIASSIFLSRFYLEQQYDSLHISAKEIYEAIDNNETINYTNISAILIQDGTIFPLTHSKMGMVPFLRSISDNSFKTKGLFENALGDEFLYYKLETDIGDIIVFQNNQYSTEYLNIVYITLFFIFISALIVSIPLISILGKRLTKPILKLEKVASSISKGNFDIDYRVNTNDEIETLSESLNQMAISLKRKYQLQREFIANVSHDFKTPLSVIRSYSEAINDGFADDENTEKYSSEIIKEVDRLNSLVTDLLQLSKLQDKAYPLKKEFFNLPEFIQGCVNHFKQIITEKNMSFIISIDSIEVFADKKYLQRVLYNFIDNAIKFGFENSKIEIFTTKSNNYIKLSVKNYGMGIENHLLDDIWDKYFKNTQSGGMGLGLPICKEILKMHNFKYGVSSSDTQGTEFYFLVPKKDISNLA